MPTPAATPKKVPLKIWKDWSAGVGYAMDDGETPGMYFANGMLGMRGELRVAPFLNEKRHDDCHGYWPQSDTKILLMAAVTISATEGDLCDDIAAGGTSGSANGVGLTFAYTINSIYENYYLCVNVQVDTDAGPTGVTYDGVAMTKLVEVAAGGIGNGNVSIWGLVNPTHDNVAHNVVISGLAAGTDIIGGALCYRDAAQTGQPFATDSDAVSCGTAPDYCSTVCATESGSATFSAALSDDVGINDHSDLTSHTARAQGGIYGRAGWRYQTAFYHPIYFIEEEGGTNHAFMYVFRTSAVGSSPRYPKLTKVVLQDTSFNFADVMGEFTFEQDLDAGQPAHYQNNWFFPAGGVTISRKLTVGDGRIDADTLTAPASVTNQTEDHLGNVNAQLFGHREGEGVRVLKINGDPTADGDWGPYFPVGDKEERALGIASLGANQFVMNREGLFTFVEKGRSELVFEDFRSWRNAFKYIPMSPWKGGMALPHPSGLLLHIPGNLPFNIGLTNKQGPPTAMQPAGITDYCSGRYMGTKGSGDFLWAVYQPVASGQTAYLCVGYPEVDDPRYLVWQIIGEIELNLSWWLTGVGVTHLSRPISNNYTTPVVWTSTTIGRSLAYVILDQRAGPFRTRDDTHKTSQSSFAYMSELFFEQPVDLQELVVYTRDMNPLDEFSLSIFANGKGVEENLSASLRGDSRHTIPLKDNRVHRLTVKVTFTTTDTTDRVPPAISRMELYGKPT
jgi:hypothetical protein